MDLPELDDQRKVDKSENEERQNRNSRVYLSI